MLNYLLKKLKLKNEKPSRNNVSLVNMPDVVIKEILDRLDYQSILRLRKVSRGLRYSVDRIKPDLKLRKFHLHIRKFHPHRISFQIWIGESQKRDYIDYRQTELGCTVGWYKEHQYKERSFRNTNFMDICMKDFENFMKFQRSILEVIYVNLYITPSLTIEKIDSENMSKMKIDELEVLEQWKNAENLKIWGFELDGRVESLVGQFSMVKLNTEVVIMNGLVC
ncbi:unnamed protein product [Caenorhabditis brenneri]